MSMERVRDYGEIEDCFSGSLAKPGHREIPRDFGVGEPLFPSEILMIRRDRAQPRHKLTGLARSWAHKWRGTKQVQNSIEKHATRYRDVENMKEVLFAMTKGGIRRRAMKYHRRSIEKDRADEFLDEEKLVALKKCFHRLFDSRRNLSEK